MDRMLRASFYAMAFFTVARASDAATILISPVPTTEITLVTIDGTLNFTDSEQFRKKVSTVSNAIVAFRSDGGSIIAGIDIGRQIHERKYFTLVPDNVRCLSACALAWLGGTHRFMEAKSKIGLNRIYDVSSGTNAGSALVGSYLSRIGLTEEAINYITQTSSNSMPWLTMSEAQQSGIDVALFTPLNQQPVPKLAMTPEATPFVITIDAMSLRRKAREFILSMYKLWNSPNSNSILSFLDTSYGPETYYYGSVTAKQSILADKRIFIERWPQRDYQIRDGSMSVQCESDSSTCRVDGIIDWKVNNPSRKAKLSGSATFSYGLNLAEPISILQESSFVLTRESRFSASEVKERQ